jgi:hypothetical protein
MTMPIVRRSSRYYVIKYVKSLEPFGIVIGGQKVRPRDAAFLHFFLKLSALSPI